MTPKLTVSTFLQEAQNVAEFPLPVVATGKKHSHDGRFLAVIEYDAVPPLQQRNGAPVGTRI